MSGVYTDSEGVWMTAAAPLIYDGDVVGIVQVDRPVGVESTDSWCGKGSVVRL